MLINEHCGNNFNKEKLKKHTRNTIKRYYENDLELDLIEYGEKLNETKHFPRFCATFLAQQKVFFLIKKKIFFFKLIFKAEPIYFLIDNKLSNIYLQELNILLKIIGADTAKMLEKKI
jgi:hypothetical protein